MIEITTGTIGEKIIKILQKTYPVTVNDLANMLNISQTAVMREIQKFQTKGIVQLDFLPNKTYIRLLRNDFSFVGKKRQRKFIKHKSGGKRYQQDEYDGFMYS
ncbi:MAG: winged helix-turn-helix domain-containing protein [Candidatus Thermoplasmatota archaeon]|nr:winged helix-turn-helix domain-containing protein [Candidatus Thermoplasmatota archaeon]